MNETGNRRAFATTEFDRWAEPEGMLPEERRLIDRYLDPDLATLEGGCGGGRMLTELASLGFSNLTGFDIVDELAARAKDRLAGTSAEVVVADAADLPFASNAFDQVLYMQQMLSFLAEEERKDAVGEVFRVLRPGGMLLVSALDVAARRSSTTLRLWMKWVRLVRSFRYNPMPSQYLPWIKIGGRVRVGALLDRPPFARWFEAGELAGEFASAGFEIVAATVSSRVRDGRVYPAAADVPEREPGDVLFLVCRRPQ